MAHDGAPRGGALCGRFARALVGPDGSRRQRDKRQTRDGFTDEAIVNLADVPMPAVVRVTRP